MTPDKQRIIITEGPGRKSGIDKTSVAIEGVGPRGLARHYTDTSAAMAYKDELREQYPNAEVVTLPRKTDKR